MIPAGDGTATARASFEVTDEALERAAAHLMRLVDRDSTSGREAPGVDEAEAVARELELPVRRLPVAEGRDNLLVGDPQPRVLLCTHLDTVPPFIPARREGDVIHGRGSADAKGVAVAMLYGLERLAAAGRAQGAACLLVVGEETDHAGARAALTAGLAPEVIVLGEPCGMRPAVAQKGLLKLRLTTAGASGHSAYPDTGVSAVHRLLDGLQALRTARLPADATLGETTVNVGQIRGGVAANVIAPSAEAVVLIRCAAPVDAVLAEILGRMPTEVAVEELSRAEPLEFFTGGEPSGRSVPFNTDAHTLAPLGARMMLMGPGDMRCAHSPREHLSLPELREAIARFADLCGRLLT